MNWHPLFCSLKEERQGCKCERRLYWWSLVVWTLRIRLIVCDQSFYRPELLQHEQHKDVVPCEHQIGSKRGMSSSIAAPSSFVGIHSPTVWIFHDWAHTSLGSSTVMYWQGMFAIIEFTVDNCIVNSSVWCKWIVIHIQWCECVKYKQQLVCTEI